MVHVSKDLCPKDIIDKEINSPMYARAALYYTALLERVAVILSGKPAEALSQLDHKLSWMDTMSDEEEDALLRFQSLHAARLLDNAFTLLENPYDLVVPKGVSAKEAATRFRLAQEFINDCNPKWIRNAYKASEENFLREAQEAARCTLAEIATDIAKNDTEFEEAASAYGLLTKPTDEVVTDPVLTEEGFALLREKVRSEIRSKHKHTIQRPAR